MKCIFKDIYTLIDTFNDLKVIKLVLFGEYTCTIRDEQRN